MAIVLVDAGLGVGRAALVLRLPRRPARRASQRDHDGVRDLDGHQRRGRRGALRRARRRSRSGCSRAGPTPTVVAIAALTLPLLAVANMTREVMRLTLQPWRYIDVEPCWRPRRQRCSASLAVTALDARRRGRAGGHLRRPAPRRRLRRRGSRARTCTGATTWRRLRDDAALRPAADPGPARRCGRRRTPTGCCWPASRTSTRSASTPSARASPRRRAAADGVHHRLPPVPAVPARGRPGGRSASCAGAWRRCWPLRCCSRGCRWRCSAPSSSPRHAGLRATRPRPSARWCSAPRPTAWPSVFGVAPLLIHRRTDVSALLIAGHGRRSTSRSAWL